MSDPLAPFRPFASHADVYRRADLRPDWTGIHLRESSIAQGADINDAVALERRGRTSIGDMIARDGDRIEGADIGVDTTAGTLTLDTGVIYVRGAARKVAAAVLNAVPMVGDFSIGVRITSTLVDHVADPALLGLHPGSAAEGEPGALVEVEALAWGFAGDGQTGSLVPVYRLINGVVIDQTPPADLSVAQQALRRFTQESLGGYITRGFELHALGKVGTDQVFSLAAGSAYVRGANITRNQSMRITQTEDPDTGSVDAEPQSFEDGGSGTATIELRRTPVQAITSVIVTKETTETLSRGAGTGTTDTLSNDSVISIVSVVQGGTIYDGEADFYQDGDAVNWSPGGAEPTLGSSYDVTYRYLDSVPVVSFTDTSVTISGGVTGELVLVGYSFKLPRIDRLCLEDSGLPIYVKGVSSALNPLPPAVPEDLVKVATIHNSWSGNPLIDLDGVRNYTFEEQDRYFRAVEQLQDLVGLEMGTRDIDLREPTAKQGIFVDPFTSGRYRDEGEPQTAAVFAGGMELPITVVWEDIDLGAPQFLPFTEEVIVRQDLASGCEKINPYQVFTPPPARLTLNPAIDFWEVNLTEESEVTQQFGTGNRSAVASVVTETIGTRQEAARFLRQIPVQFTIEGMGAGEDLQVLDFDGVDVTPNDLTADSQGTITGTFTIPASVPTGSKAVGALGAGGSVAAAEFVGEGTITTAILRRVTTLRRWTDPPPPVWSIIPVNTGVPSNGDGGDRGSLDPQAQTFMIAQDRMLTGIDVQFCAIGDRSNPVIVELVTVENGIPTTNRVAQAEIDMNQVVTNQWTQPRFSIPIFVPRNTEHAYVFKTDDADHSIRVATRGDFIEETQEFVGAQPYTVGVRLSSSNARTWTPHQNSDIMMRIPAAVYDPTTRTVDLGTIANVENISDIIIRAGVDLPTAAARCVFEIEFDDTSVQQVEPGQPLRLSAFYSGDLKLRAVLTGSSTITPILFANVLVALGTLQATGTYVSRAFSLGETVRLTTRLKTLLPTGSTVTLEQDAADGNWTALTPGAVELIQQGWQERVWDREPITATNGRLRITLTGNPAARPVLADLRGAIL